MRGPRRTSQKSASGGDATRTRHSKQNILLWHNMVGGREMVPAEHKPRADLHVQEGQGSNNGVPWVDVRALAKCTGATMQKVREPIAEHTR